MCFSIINEYEKAVTPQTFVDIYMHRYLKEEKHMNCSIE